MSLFKIVGILLVAGGTLALVYHGFNYTSEKHTARLGSLEFDLKEKKRLEIPVWAGVVAVVAGAAFLVLPGKRGR